MKNPFSSDPVRTVHTTYERFGISDSKERAVAPTEIIQRRKKKKIAVALNQLNE